MKKIITYTIITTLISCFSYISPSFADTKMTSCCGKNENVIKLDLKENNIFNLTDNNDYIFLNNNISSPTTEIDCSGKQTMYSFGGIVLGGIGGALLAFLIGTGLASRASGPNQPGLGILYITFFAGLPISAILGALFGGVKGNEFAINECSINKNK